MNAGFRVDERPPASRATSDHGLGVRSMTGRVLAGRWTILSTLGVGGTGTVYEAIHRNGRRVAVKVLHPSFADHASVRRRFLSEGYAANRVRHPDAVGILDDGEEADGTAFLVMELLRGQSFAAILRERGPLPVAEVASVALAVLEVLAAAHENGVIHRDIKPGNIFRTDEGRIKLLDFGVALVADSSSVITNSGAAIGTPAFMAPEQAAGRSTEIDAITDLWAVGATMFQLLTGSLVHDATSGNTALVAAATRAARSIASLAPNIPTEVAKVVDRALRFERSERWPNARAMHRALQRASGQGRSLAPETTSPETAPEGTASPIAMRAPARKSSSFGRGSWLASLVVLALLAYFVWLTRNGARASASSPSHALQAAPASVSAPTVSSTVASRAMPSATPLPVAPAPISSGPHVTSAARANKSLKAAPAPDAESSLLDRRK